MSGVPSFGPVETSGIVPSLGFRPERDPKGWREEVRLALRTVLGSEPDSVPLEVRVDDDVVSDGVRDTRFSFMTEPGERITAHLLRPAAVEGNVPVMICLQGHNSGARISMGVAASEEDRAELGMDRDYAVQALARGWAAVVFDQRGFGERSDSRPEGFRHGLEWRPCHHLTSVALLKGRTLLGERVWDVSRAIDALASFDGIDLGRIGCIGDSTGGAVAYFAAAVDERIALAVPAAYVSSFRYSLLQHDHCEDHYLPGFLRFFELGDLAILIAPRPIVVVVGAQDISFPIAGALEAFERIEEIYHMVGAADAARLVQGPEGHRFYADLAWPVITDLSGWKVSSR